MTAQAKPRYDVGTQLADDPLVTVIDDFVTEAERTHIMTIAGRRMGEAKVSKLGENAPSQKRTGSVAWIKHDQTPLVRGLVKRVSDLVEIPVHHAESLQVIHYGETQEYQPHYDAWDINTEKGLEKTAQGGQRLVTALMYLNEVDAGGGTTFPNIDLIVNAVPGRMVIFHNLYPGESERHIDSLHGGMPVFLGEKWACNLWFREEPYQKGRTSLGGPPRVKATRAARPVSRKNKKAQRSARKKNR
jgi:prolyl 4-hydroxylase